MKLMLQIATLSLALTSLAVVPGATRASDDADQVETIEAGKKLVTRSCSECHAVGREGASSHKDAPPFREVVKLYPTEHLAEALGEGIISGHPDMPEFVFSPDEVGEILDYLESLKRANPPGE